MFHILNNNCTRVIIKYKTFIGLKLFLIFQSWRQTSKVFYQITLALVIMQKILKNGKMLLEKLKDISKMKVLEDGAAIIAKRLGTLRL